MEYYSSFKRKKILTHAIAWMKLKDIVLKEMSVTKGQILCNSAYITGID